MMSPKTFYLIVAALFLVNVIAYIFSVSRSKNYMPVFKIVVSALLIVVSARIIYLFIWFNLYSQDTYQSISEQAIGMASCLMLMLGGVLLLKKSCISAVMLLGSTLLYFFGGLAPLWHEYGWASFNMLISTFYQSTAIRLVFLCAVIFIYYQESAANKSLKDAP